MTRLWIAMVLTVLMAGLATATNISGELSGTLIADSYILVGDVSIVEGETLIIEPGATFISDPDSLYAYSLIVGENRTLICQGTESDSIRFTRLKDIRIDNSGDDDVFEYCVVTEAQWGAFRCLNNSSPTISHCTMKGYGNYMGGPGIYCYISNPTISYCTISECYSNSGGGIACNNSNPIIDSCVISNNAASSGGGIGCLNSSPLISNCTIINNDYLSPIYEGGGIYCGFESSPVIANCVIAGNNATGGGGITCVNNSNPTIDGCTITANTSTSGAGICSYQNSHPVIINTAITGNIGPAVLTFENGNPTISYCDFVDNTGGDFVGDGVDPNLGVIVGTNANGDPCDAFSNIFLDPMFVSPMTYDFHLQAGSPCIDAGDLNPPDDPDNSCTDIGAFYYHQDGILPMLRGEISGILPAGDYNVIDSLYVPDGESLTLEAGVNLLFSSEFLWIIGENQTLICQGTESDSIRFQPYYDHGYTQWGNLVITDSGSDDLMEYCVLEGSHSVSIFEYPLYLYGGALCLNYSSPAIQHCSIRNNNTETGMAAGMTISGGNPTISHCSFTGNSGDTQSMAGAIFCEGGALIEHCRIDNNFSHNSVSGIIISSSDAVLSYCTVTGNVSGQGSAAVRLWSASAIVDHCTVDGNKDMFDNPSVGMSLWFAHNATITNTIISGSSTGVSTGESLDDVTIANCCFHDNIYDDIYSWPEDPTYGDLTTVNANGDSCDVYQNLFMDPMYEDPATGDFSLQSGSPCIDAGDPAFPLDPDNTFTDIGAFTYNHDPVEVTLEPTSETTIPMLGGTLEFDVRIASYLGTAYPGAMFWTKVMLPNGEFYPTVLFQTTFTLQPYMDITGSLTQDIPPFAPPGNYEMWGWVGANPNGGPQFGHSFPFDKENTPEGPDTGGNDSWASTGSFEFDELAGIIQPIPTEYALAPAYPNPFNPTTTITVALPAAAELNVAVFNTLGQQVAELANCRIAAGTHNFTLNGSSLASGIYFVQATVPGELLAVQKIIMMK
jgi:Right handed beta helix region/Secretion system C-terminal sorting domain